VRFETGAVSHTLNVGGGWRYKRIAFTYLQGGFENPWIENHFKGFVNEQIAIGRFGAVASLRADLHPLIPISQTISPRGALLYRLFDKTSLRASAGSAYRAPNGIESYMDLTLPTPVDAVFITDLGNQDLRPERINTVELGVHDESSYFHMADVAVYLNQVTDLIFLDDVTVGIVPFDDAQGGVEVGTTGWVNLDPTYTGVGVEADTELYPTDGLDVYLNANLMRVVETSDGETLREGSASTLKLNGGLSWRTPWRTDLSLSGTYYSAQEWRLREFDPDTLALVAQPRPIDPRFLASARVAVRPLPSDDLEVALTVWNITELVGGDGFLEHPEGQPVIGRAHGSITYRF
jgi:outer membrane receptor for ferrienterochelin and colicin